MPIKKEGKLSFKLKAEVCSAIQDTGFIGSAEEYVRTFHKKEFGELTVCEAEMIVRTLGNKPGCLYGTKEGGYDAQKKGEGTTGILEIPREDFTGAEGS